LTTPRRFPPPWTIEKAKKEDGSDESLTGIDQDRRGHAVRGAGIGTIGYVGPDARRRAVKRFRAGAARTMRNPPSRYPCVLAP
jgi:hypothetical protein